MEKFPLSVKPPLHLAVNLLNFEDAASVFTQTPLLMLLLLGGAFSIRGEGKTPATKRFSRRKRRDAKTPTINTQRTIPVRLFRHERGESDAGKQNKQRELRGKNNRKGGRFIFRER